jgi:hypothetical protein
LITPGGNWTLRIQLRIEDQIAAADLSIIRFFANKQILEVNSSKFIVDVDSLAIASGRGVKTRLKGFEEVIKQQIELHNRNIKNILTFLK